MEFQDLAEVCERLTTTTKRTLMTNWVGDFLKQLEDDEVEPAVSMILARPFPKWDQRTLDVSWTTLNNIIRGLTRTSWKEFSAPFRETGDIGSATQVILGKNKIRRQATLLGSPLTILEVRRVLEATAESTGQGSRERKERLIGSLFGRASPLAAKYLVKIIIGEMRTGFHEGLMEIAVSIAFSIPLKTVQTATMLTGDIGEVATICRKHGKEGITMLSFKVFRPINQCLPRWVKTPRKPWSGTVGRPHSSTSWTERESRSTNHTRK